MGTFPFLPSLFAIYVWLFDHFRNSFFLPSSAIFCLANRLFSCKSKFHFEKCYFRAFVSFNLLLSFRRLPKFHRLLFLLVFVVECTATTHAKRPSAVLSLYVDKVLLLVLSWSQFLLLFSTHNVCVHVFCLSADDCVCLFGFISLVLHFFWFFVHTDDDFDVSGRMRRRKEKDGRDNAQSGQNRCIFKDRSRATIEIERTFHLLCVCVCLDRIHTHAVIWSLGLRLGLQVQSISKYNQMIIEEMEKIWSHQLITNRTDLFW